MNNNTETIEQLEAVVKKLLNVPENYLDGNSWDKIEFGVKCIRWQKEQDEAKYKELLDNHNELLELLRNSRPLMQPRKYCKGDDYLILGDRIEKAIKKSKNI